MNGTPEDRPCSQIVNRIDNHVFPRTVVGRCAAGAFTLIELLVVISIIAILLGMFLVAFKYIRNSGARSTTKVSMDSLKGMLAEYDTASHLNRAPVMWNWYQPTPNGGTVNISSGPYGTPALSPDFWRYPYSTTATGSGTPAVWEALDSPGQVQTDLSPQSELQRAASNAVLNTQLALQLMAGVTANKAAFDNLPNGVKYYLPWVAGKLLPTSVTNIGLLDDDGMGVGSVTISYPQGVHVSLAGNFYVSLQQTSAPPAPNPTHTSLTWYDETAAPRGVPVILDGWGNPIIFVPASGLHVRVLNGKSTYNFADPTQNYIVTSPEGVVSGQYTVAPVVSKVGRPFFASAGPDGDFTKGDDNIYSFEN